MDMESPIHTKRKRQNKKELLGGNTRSDTGCIFFTQICAMEQYLASYFEFRARQTEGFPHQQ